jgi:hypothetical protein
VAHLAGEPAAVEHVIEALTARPAPRTGEVAWRRFGEIDDGVVARVTAGSMLVMPHGGPRIRELLDARFEEDCMVAVGKKATPQQIVERLQALPRPVRSSGVAVLVPAAAEAAGPAGGEEGEGEPPATVVAQTAVTMPLEYAPGTHFNYSNNDIMLAGLALSRTVAAQGGKHCQRNHPPQQAAAATAAAGVSGG